MNSHRRPSHVHSSSYPSTPSLLSSVAGSSAHLRETQSESGSNPPSSPRIQSPASSPGHPSKAWKVYCRSRDPAVERLSRPLLSPKHSTPRRTPSTSTRTSSTPTRTPSPSFLDRMKSYPRPWKNSPRKNAVPLEQAERYQNTRVRVESAIRPVFPDLAGDMAHEVLLRGAELLKFSPFPGLEGAAKVLLGIWDALQNVETNRLACLRLTERCADILIAIQEEVSGLDKRVADALYEPIAKLENAFREIESMMLIEIDQTPFKRYLRRDEVLEEIANCNTKLQDCLGHFDRSINLRVLEFGLASKGPPFARNEMSGHGIEEIHEIIRRIQERQNDLDRSCDLIDQQNYTQLQGLGSGQEVLDKLGIEKKDIPDAVKTLLRTLESLRSTNVFEKVSTSVSSLRRSSTWPVSHTDAIALRLQDRESIERDIRNLKAAYGEPVPTLPSWTITKFEIDLGEIIGRGFFSTVYKGKWGTRIVAVKVVEVYTSKESFVDEVNLWKKFDHPNILQIYGASSAEGTLPWFLVSPLMIHGNVADYLKRVNWNLQRHKESGSTAPDAGHQSVDFLQMMHDVAEGMRYLHAHGVYHGDLKAANVLVTEHFHCVVSDFGLSKWITRAEQRNFLPNHALRWQAPELMAGNPVPTKNADVYAFAMCCVEILTMGSMPWPTMKDDDVRRHVLAEKGRPPYPTNLVRDLRFEPLLHRSWHQSPYNRPSFEQLAQILQVLREQVAVPNLVLSSPRVVISAPPEIQDQDLSPYEKFESPVSHIPEDLHLSPRVEYSTPFMATLDKLESGIEVLYDESEVESPLEGHLLIFDPPPEKSPNTFDMKEPYEDQFELTYRMCLSHDFPRQLNFPLWTPSDVQLGDIGFLSRGGQFMRLFNSINPQRSSRGRMNIPGVGSVSIAVSEQKDNLVRKGFRAISKLMSPGEGSNDRINHRHTFSLAGGRTAFLSAEKTHHRYIQDSRPCKQWFRKHWHAIIDEYGAEHKLLKEDLMFIVETLNAQHYALFVNHGHLDDKVHFEVFSSPGQNEPWGAFVLPPEQPDAPQRVLFGRVSTTGMPSKTILVARLRFQTDVEEPTLLNI